MIQKKYSLSDYSWLTLFFLICLGLGACSSHPIGPLSTGYRTQYSHQNVWNQKNLRITKYINIYSMPSNRSVKLALKKAQPYLAFIKMELKKRNLPPELAYLPMLESAFNPRALSRTGARGMWQFTKETAKDYGLRVGWFVDDRLNWRKSTQAAVKYLSVLGKKFNYNWELALAAYNGGPGYIQRALTEQQSWNFWELNLNSEPQNYVPKFLAMLQVAQQKYIALYRGST